MSKMRAQLRMHETQILRSQTGPSAEGQSSPSGARRVGRGAQTGEAIPKTETCKKLLTSLGLGFFIYKIKIKCLHSGSLWRLNINIII